MKSEPWLALFLFLLCPYACRPGLPDGVLKKKPPKGYVDTRVGTGDVLQIQVLGEELPVSYRVSPSGFIDFPYVRQVKVLGLTPEEVARRIARKLSNGYYRNPQVYVFVKDYASKRIIIFGQVKRPGIYAYKDKMNIVQAITMAGGFNDTADRNSTTVTRIIRGRKHRMRVKVQEIGEGRIHNFMLRPGDTIFVPKRFF